jgi:kynurenine formamidase
VDLTHFLTADFPTFPGGKSFELEPILTDSEKGVNLNKIPYWEHVGTHIDAPIYFT